LNLNNLLNLNNIYTYIYIYIYIYSCIHYFVDRGMTAQTREPEESDEFASETSGVNMQSPAAV